MKYNVGDKVRIKPKNHFCSVDDFNNINMKDEFFNEYSRLPYCETTMTIGIVNKDFYILKEDRWAYKWTDEMIECKVEEETKPKFKVGDKITNGKTQLTILTITSNEYIVEDNFGECGTLYFNTCGDWKLVEEEMSLDKAGQITDFEYDGLAYTLPDGYKFVDENGNVINAQKIVLEKKHNDKLKLESTKTVREYWSEYARIYIEIYDDEPNECVLTHLYTLEGHRQKGYGRQALIEAESIAKELGCHTTYLKVETDSWMHEWYLRMGYKWYKNVNKEYTWLAKSI